MANGGSVSCPVGVFLANATAISALSGTYAQVYCKIRFKVDTLKALTSGTGNSHCALGSAAIEGKGFTLGFQGVTGGKYKTQLQVNNDSANATSAGTSLQSALPANGNYLVSFIWWDGTGGTAGFVIFDDSGNSYDTATVAVSGNLTSVGGIFNLNDSSITGFDTDQANVYQGVEIGLGTLTGSARYSPPIDGSASALWWCNDAPGSTSAAATLGGQALAVSGGTATFTGNNGSLWGPAVTSRARTTVIMLAANLAAQRAHTLGRGRAAHEILVTPKAKPRFQPAVPQRAREILVRSPIVTLSRQIQARMPRMGGGGHVHVYGPVAKPRFIPAVTRLARHEIVISTAANQAAIRARIPGRRQAAHATLSRPKRTFVAVRPGAFVRLFVAAFAARQMAIARRTLGKLTFPTSTRTYIPRPKPRLVLASKRYGVHIAVATFTSLLKAVLIRKPRTGLGRSTLNAPRAKPRFTPATARLARHINVSTYATGQQAQRARLLGRFKAARALLIKRVGVVGVVIHGKPHVQVLTQARQKALFARQLGRGFPPSTSILSLGPLPGFIPAVPRDSQESIVLSFAARDKARRARQAGRSYAAKAITTHVLVRFQPAVPIVARHVTVYTVAAIQAAARARVLGRRQAAITKLIKPKRVYTPAKVAPVARYGVQAVALANRYRVLGRARAARSILIAPRAKPRFQPAVARVLTHLKTVTVQAQQAALRSRLLGRGRAAKAIRLVAKFVFVAKPPRTVTSIVVATFNAQQAALRARAPGRGRPAHAVVAKAKRVFQLVRPQVARHLNVSTFVARGAQTAARLPGRGRPATPHLITPRPKARFIPAIGRTLRHIVVATFAQQQVVRAYRSIGRGRPARVAIASHRGLIAAVPRVARKILTATFASVQRALRQRLAQHGHSIRSIPASVMAGAGQPAATVIVTPAVATIPVGGSQQLTVQVFDAHGNPLPNAPVSYGSSNTSAAIVSSTGLVQWVAGGSATIVALSGSAAGMSLITTQVETYLASTSNPNVAIGSPTGRIVRVGPGTATVTFSLKATPGVSVGIPVTFT